MSDAAESGQESSRCRSDPESSRCRSGRKGPHVRLSALGDGVVRSGSGRSQRPPTKPRWKSTCAVFAMKRTRKGWRRAMWRVRQWATRPVTTRVYEQGVEEGRRDARAEAARLAQMADTFKIALQAADAVVAEALTALALDIAQQVVSQHLTLRSDRGAGRCALGDRRRTGVVRSAVSDRESGGSPDCGSVFAGRTPGGGNGRSGPTRILSAAVAGRTRQAGEIDATNVTRWERVAAALGRSQPW